ncbi:MAG: hypothetical protein SH817_15255 [Leptospira sp.]|nr:hypothetical protein [Leptospira sp.]
MTDRNKWIIGGLGLLALVFVTFFLFSGGKEEKETKNNNLSDEDRSIRSTAKSLFDDPEFADAPTPEDEELGQAETLWPFALERKPDRKEKVKEEWREFAAKYPKNFYIPREMRPTRTEAEEKAAAQTLDDFTAMDASIAADLSKNKWAEVGSTPGAEPKKPAPEKQRAYFDFKINELQSRIQMVEYWMENNQPNANDKINAQKDISLWKKELSVLEDVRSQVPKS